MTKEEKQRRSHVQKRIDEIREERDRLDYMLANYKFANEERQKVEGWRDALNRKMVELQFKTKPVTDMLCGGVEL